MVDILIAVRIFLQVFDSQGSQGLINIIQVIIEVKYKFQFFENIFFWTLSVVLLFKYVYLCTLIEINLEMTLGQVQLWVNDVFLFQAFRPWSELASGPHTVFRAADKARWLEQLPCTSSASLM